MSWRFSPIDFGRLWIHIVLSHYKIILKVTILQFRHNAGFIETNQKHYRFLFLPSPDSLFISRFAINLIFQMFINGCPLARKEGLRQMSL